MLDSMEENSISTSPVPISLKVTEKIIEQMKSNSICRIDNNGNGAGFFVKIPYKSRLLPVLITTNHIINQDDILSNKEITLYLNNDEITIKLDRNRLIYTNEKLNITIIEIKESDHDLNIYYLKLDNKLINYIKINKKQNPYYLNNLYLNESIYLINNTKGEDIFVSYGKLLYANNSDIIHNSNMKEDSSGSPILLINNQKLIGIHCGSSQKYKNNKGRLLIYSIIEFSKIKNNLLIINKGGKNIKMNYIIGEFDIKEDEKNVRIINSYEESYRDKYNNEKEKENEKEIKENCMMFVDGEFIQFSYFNNFNKKGKYTILYIFKNNITNTNYMFNGCSSLININLSNFNFDNVNNMSHMFKDCSSLTNINLSNFNTNNVTNMSFLFYKCSSLTNINLSNFNTNNVIDMSCLFCECSSLKNIDLSNFNTNKVMDMCSMFSGCLSLKNIDLSNFDTNKVTDMKYMFNRCSSLTNINLSNFNTMNVTNMNNMFSRCSSLVNVNLSNFNTVKVTNMGWMFCKCSSLTNINLSNFNTINVIDMNWMFNDCSSLKNINLSNFNTDKVDDMTYMFFGCSSLKKGNIITKDKKILTEFKK